MQSPEYARQPRRPVCMLPVVSHLLCSVSSAPVCDCCRRCCQMSCPSGTDCVQPDQLCNGKQDCTDGSDESADYCGSFNCSSKGEVGAAKARRFELLHSGNASASMRACIELADGHGSMPRARRSGCLTPRCNLVAYFASILHSSTGRLNVATSPTALLRCTLRPCASLPRSQVTCPSGVGCMRDNSSLCDGVPDCLDGSDESADLCNATFCEAKGVVSRGQEVG